MTVALYVSCPYKNLLWEFAKYRIMQKRSRWKQWRDEHLGHTKHFVASSVFSEVISSGFGPLWVWTHASTSETALPNFLDCNKKNLQSIAILYQRFSSEFQKQVNTNQLLTYHCNWVGSSLVRFKFTALTVCPILFRLFLELGAAPFCS